MERAITKDTAVSISVVVIIASAVWWASAMQSDMNSVKTDLKLVKEAVLGNTSLTLNK